MSKCSACDWCRVYTVDNLRNGRTNVHNEGVQIDHDRRCVSPSRSICS